MTDKKPRKNKGKLELEWEMKQKQEAARKRTFVGDVFFPLLKKHTKSIHQAKQVCKILQNDIMSTFNMGMKEPVATLNLTQKMDENESEGANAYRELVAIFANSPISEAMELIGGMPEAIEGGLSVEEWGRSLDDLDFVDGTMKLKAKPDLAILCEQLQCNEFRQLMDGKWVAYSLKKNTDGDVSYRAQGDTMLDALLALKELIHANTN